MIELAFEVPIPDLRTFAEHSDYELALAHLIVQNEEYRKFFVEQREKGKLVVLDNSAWEMGDTINVDLVIQAAKILRPQAVVAPDYFDGVRTVKETKEFVERAKRELPGPLSRNIWGVVRGKSFKEGMWVFENIRKIPEVARICVPFSGMFEVPGEVKLDSPTQTLMQRRILLVRILKELGLNGRPIHLFGCSGLVEMYFQAQIPEVLSIDTSSPIKHGIHRIRFSPCFGLPGEKKQDASGRSLLKMDYGAKIPEECYDDILWNIKVTRAFTKGCVCEEEWLEDAAILGRFAMLGDTNAVAFLKKVSNFLGVSEKISEKTV